MLSQYYIYTIPPKYAVNHTAAKGGYLLVSEHSAFDVNRRNVRHVASFQAHTIAEATSFLDAWVSDLYDMVREKIAHD